MFSEADLYKDIDLHDWEELLSFFTQESVEKTTERCKANALVEAHKQNDPHPGCIYANLLCNEIAYHINKRYPNVCVEPFINCVETSLNLSYGGNVEKISGIYDYIAFQDTLTGFEELRDMIESITSTADNARSETLELLRLQGVDETIDSFIVEDEDEVYEILTKCDSHHIVDDYPQRALAAAMVAKKLIAELTQNTEAELISGNDGFSFAVNVKLPDGTKHNISCYDDMSRLLESCSVA